MHFIFLEIIFFGFLYLDRLCAQHVINNESTFNLYGQRKLFEIVLFELECVIDKIIISYNVLRVLTDEGIDGDETLKS